MEKNDLIFKYAILVLVLQREHKMQKGLAQCRRD